MQRPVAGHGHIYPVLFLMKEPVALLVLMVLAPFVWRKEGGSFRTTLIVSGVIGIGTLFFFMFLNNKNIGIRHLLPVYPFVFLLLSWIGSIRPRFLISKASWALVAIYVAGGLISFPDYLVHFNTLVGGPDNGLRYSVVGEDWGQDVAALGRHGLSHLVESRLDGIPPDIGANDDGGFVLHHLHG